MRLAVKNVLATKLARGQDSSCMVYSTVCRCRMLTSRSETLSLIEHAETVHRGVRGRWLEVGFNAELPRGVGGRRGNSAWKPRLPLPRVQCPIPSRASALPWLSKRARGPPGGKPGRGAGTQQIEVVIGCSWAMSLHLRAIREMHRLKGELTGKDSRLSNLAWCDETLGR